MSDDRDWHELIDRHLHGELNEAEKELLAERLDSDPSARREFVELAQWDTLFADVLRESGKPDSSPRNSGFEELIDASIPARTETMRRQKATITFTRALLAVSGAAVVVLAVSLFRHWPVADTRIATITGSSGSLQWTGNGGRIDQDLSVGAELAGGTVEGLGPDSWFELQFIDGSTVKIRGSSMLTLADDGQKVLHLREGNLSANVEPQPAGKPMLVYTRSAMLTVIGTQFEVEAEAWSTTLNVNEGSVEVERIIDGETVHVAANYRVIAAPDHELSPLQVPESVSTWKSQLHQGPHGTHGEWLAATGEQAARLRGVPFVPPDFPSDTLYMLGLSVSRDDGSRVILQPDSRFVVRGRIGSAPRVFFGIQVAHANGDFAGKFREDQAVSTLNDRGEFEIVFQLSEFDLDPCVLDQKDELPGSPDGLFLTNVWCFAVKQETGIPDLELTDIELITPDEESMKLDL